MPPDFLDNQPDLKSAFGSMDIAENEERVRRQGTSTNWSKAAMRSLTNGIIGNLKKSLGQPRPGHHGAFQARKTAEIECADDQCNRLSNPSCSVCPRYDRVHIDMPTQVQALAPGRGLSSPRQTV